MKYRNLTIIGTSHVAKQSVEDVRHALDTIKPGIVAIELDRKRYNGMMSEKKQKRRLSDVFKVGVKGYMFAVIGGWLEKKLGDYTGVAPGSEMLTAINLSRQRRIKLSLIDQDIEITLSRFSKGLTFREKMNFVLELFTAPFRRKKIKFDLNKVPSDAIIKELMGELKKKYPNVYRTLIVERNEIMAHNLFKLMKHYEKENIVAVIGAGHEKEIVDMIKQRFAMLEKDRK